MGLVADEEQYAPQRCLHDDEPLAGTQNPPEPGRGAAPPPSPGADQDGHGVDRDGRHSDREMDAYHALGTAREIATFRTSNARGTVFEALTVETPTAHEIATFRTSNTLLQTTRASGITTPCSGTISLPSSS